MAAGTLQLADDFVTAGDRVASAERDRASPTPFYLYAHGIELALKAYLILRGFDDGGLRKVGHDLEAALAEAQANRLSEGLALAPEGELAIRMINPYYEGKELEYLVTGFKRYPTLGALARCARTLIQRLHPLIRSELRDRSSS
jgi:hypothetical protein